jgi:hypothetical protein
LGGVRHPSPRAVIVYSVLAGETNTPPHFSQNHPSLWHRDQLLVLGAAPTLLYHATPQVVDTQCVKGISSSSSWVRRDFIHLEGAGWNSERRCGNLVCGHCRPYACLSPISITGVGANLRPQTLGVRRSPRRTSWGTSRTSTSTEHHRPLQEFRAKEATAGYPNYASQSLIGLIRPEETSGPRSSRTHDPHDNVSRPHIEPSPRPSTCFFRGYTVNFWRRHIQSLTSNTEN